MYKIISLRSQRNGFKQRDIVSAGLFDTLEEADAKVQAMNAKGNRIYSHYMTQKIYPKGHGFDDAAEQLIGDTL